MRTLATAFFLIGLASSPSNAQSLGITGVVSVKAPWDWTDFERVSARHDPTLMRERVRAFYQATSSTAAHGAQPESVEREEFLIDGSRNPELFMPSELFSALLGGLDRKPAFRSSMRSMVRAHLSEFGWKEEEFWQKLDEANRDHALLLNHLLDLELKAREAAPSDRRELNTEIARLQPEVCTARISALRSAKAVFGEQKLLRFLYTVVVKQMLISRPAHADDAAQTQYVEGGCK